MEFWCWCGHWNTWTAFANTSKTKRSPMRQVSETFQWHHHLHLLHNLAVIYQKREDQKCMRKHSGSDPSGLKLAELLDALLVRLPLKGSHTLVAAERIKMAGKRVAKPQQRRRRNGDSTRIQIHDHWTRVRVQQIRSRRDWKRILMQTVRTRQSKWTWIAFKGHLQLHIRWNLPVTRMCRRKRELQETFESELK